MRMSLLDQLLESADRLASRPPGTEHFDSHDTDAASLRSDILAFAEKASDEELAQLSAILANRS